MDREVVEWVGGCYDGKGEDEMECPSSRRSFMQTAMPVDEGCCKKRVSFYYGTWVSAGRHWEDT